MTVFNVFIALHKANVPSARPYIVATSGNALRLISLIALMTLHSSSHVNIQ